MITDDDHILESGDSANISGQQEVLALDVLFPPASIGHDPIKPVYMVLHGPNGGSEEEFVQNFDWRGSQQGSTVVLVMVARGKCSRVDFNDRSRQLLLKMTPLLLSLFFGAFGSIGLEPTGLMDLPIGECNIFQ